MFLKNKKRVISVIFAVLVIGAGYAVYSRFASPTNIALINFQPYMATSIRLSNNDRFVRYEEVPLEKLSKLTRYDFVLGFGMGMKITAEQRAELQRAIDKGVPVDIYAPTTPENNISTLDSLQKNEIEGYLGNGNKKNYQSLARYIRANIDKKSFFVNAPDSVVESAEDVLFHLDENLCFNTVGEYEKYLKEQGMFNPNAPKIAMVGGFNDPFSGNRENIDSIIVSFQNAGFTMYPISSIGMRMEFLQQISPDAVLYFPHGRLAMGRADVAVNWLRSRNIPVFAPLTILQTRDDWEEDKMGMFGGFLSQSVVMPELDGAIYPYVLNAQQIDEDGLYHLRAIPERLKTFTKIVSNFISLKKRDNANKKLAIFYFKGPGQSTLAAQGLETVPALYNVLKRLKSEGYNVDGLPADVKVFEKMLMSQGGVFSTYAQGKFDEFLEGGNPLLVEKSEYEGWVSQAMPASLYDEVTQLYGDAPGNYMSVNKNDKQYIAVAAVRLGNIALLPQPMAGLGDDSFAIIHGAKSPPPHTYIAPYLWAQHGFKADAMMHFGTHGSLEFTPQKQVALSSYDWSDVLVGAIPHFYYYTIGNIGESMIAKRRSYATTISYITPAFSESKTRMQYRQFTDAVNSYYKSDSNAKNRASLRVKQIAVEMGLHRELRLDSVLSKPYSEEDIERLENFAEEIATEKIIGTFYTTGIAYSPEKISSTVMAMSADPIAYSLAALDKQKGKVSAENLKSRTLFTQNYLNPAKALVQKVLGGFSPDTLFIAHLAGVTPADLSKAKQMFAPRRGGGKMQEDYSSAQKEHARAILELERTVTNITAYKKALEQSPEKELQGILNALAGGYISPSSGGDAVANPNAVPTGRNLYSINAEATPTEVAWDKGVTLAQATLEQYKKQHGEYPRKVSYTFWSSEFIESEGATIAQVLYMLGVRPVRDGFGRVSDLELIPASDLGRPRVDVVVQTSGQFRDLAASRLALITRAVNMAAKADDGKELNFVKTSAVEIEKQLVEQGLSPKDARELSTRRVFGGINGMYGTGIQEMITSSDRWDTEKEIADTYISNMGASYGDTKNWGQFEKGLLRAVLHNTDAIVQPRQSNTWGALSLDHVYEFMGGMNLAIRNVTGKDPDAYFADYRNRNNVHIQELKEAIGVESRSTVFNPEFVKELVQGGASNAERIEEIVTNTFGWNVSKPDVIDNEMWDKFYQVYVKDEFGLNVKRFFENENPSALQEITAVMMETARKGMWKATEQQLKDMAALHTELVQKYGASGAGFSGGNKKLQQFIAQKVDATNAKRYNEQLQKSEQSQSESTSQNGKVLKKQELMQQQNGTKTLLNGVIVVVAVISLFIVLLYMIRKRRRRV